MTITKEQMAEWKALAEKAADEPWRSGNIRPLAATAVPALVAEVERLRAALQEFLAWFDRQNDGMEGIHYLNGDSDKYPGNGHDDVKRIGALARAALPKEPADG